MPSGVISADSKTMRVVLPAKLNKASGYSEPTMEEIDAFIAEVRQERAGEFLKLFACS